VRFHPLRHSSRTSAFDPLQTFAVSPMLGPMALEPLWTGSQLLHKLIAYYLAGSIDTELFCSNFETAFNFDVDPNELTPLEEEVFHRLFREVVYYSPFPEEGAQIPSYRSEGQIRQAASDAQSELRTAS
jgi:hypothetical protein